MNFECTHFFAFTAKWNGFLESFQCSLFEHAITTLATFVTQICHFCYLRDWLVNLPKSTDLSLQWPILNFLLVSKIGPSFLAPECFWAANTHSKSVTGSFVDFWRRLNRARACFWLQILRQKILKDPIWRGLYLKQYCFLILRVPIWPSSADLYLILDQV